MKITLDQATLDQAVRTHLRSVGVTSDIRKVDFRYTRVPYTVFAEVDLAESAAPAPRPPPAVVHEREVVPAQPMVNPSDLPPIEETPPEEPKPEGPAAPLFSGS